MDRDRELQDMRGRVEATRGRIAETAEALAALAKSPANGKAPHRDVPASDAAAPEPDPKDEAHRVFSGAIAEAFGVTEGEPAAVASPHDEASGAVPPPENAPPAAAAATTAAPILLPVDPEGRGSVRELLAACGELAAEHPVKLAAIFCFVGAVVGRRVPVTRFERTSLGPMALSAGQRTKAFALALRDQIAAIAVETVEGALEGAAARKAPALPPLADAPALDAGASPTERRVLRTDGTRRRARTAPKLAKPVKKAAKTVKRARPIPLAKPEPESPAPDVAAAVETQADAEPIVVVHEETDAGS